MTDGLELLQGIMGKNQTSFQPKWNHGETKTIRIPVALADDIIKIAKAIDNEYIKADEILELFSSENSLDTRQAS